MVLDFLKNLHMLVIHIIFFVKRNTDIISKRIKNKFIWFPKNLSIVDKNTYIASYIHDYVIHAIMCILTDGN